MKIDYLDLRLNSRGGFDIIASSESEVVELIESWISGHLDYILIRVYMENTTGDSYSPDYYSTYIPSGIVRIKGSNDSIGADIIIAPDLIQNDDYSEYLKYIELWDRDGGTMEISLSVNGEYFPKIIPRL